MPKDSNDRESRDRYEPREDGLVEIEGRDGRTYRVPADSALDGKDKAFCRQIAMEVVRILKGDVSEMSKSQRSSLADRLGLSR
jgi:hypothetical protein